MTEPNAISSTPETSGGEDLTSAHAAALIETFAEAVRAHARPFHDTLPVVLNARLVSMWSARDTLRKALASRLSPPSSSEREDRDKDIEELGKEWRYWHEHAIRECNRADAAEKRIAELEEELAATDEAGARAVEALSAGLSRAERVAADERVDAELWRGLLDSERIRFVGGSMVDTDEAHICIEFWMKHPTASPRYDGLPYLFKYAKRLAAARSPTEDTGHSNG